MFRRESTTTRTKTDWPDIRDMTLHGGMTDSRYYNSLLLQLRDDPPPCWGRIEFGGLALDFMEYVGGVCGMVSGNVFDNTAQIFFGTFSPYDLKCFLHCSGKIFSSFSNTLSCIVAFPFLISVFSLRNEL